MLDRIEILRKTRDWNNPETELRREIDAMVLSREGRVLPKLVRWIDRSHNFDVSNQTAWDWAQMIQRITYPAPPLCNGPERWWGHVGINSSEKGHESNLVLLNNVFPDSAPYHFYLKMPKGGTAVYRAIDAHNWLGDDHTAPATPDHMRAMLYLLTNLKQPIDPLN